MVALGSMRPFLLAAHVVLSSMFAAALGAHNNSEFADLESRSAPPSQAHNAPHVGTYRVMLYYRSRAFFCS